MPKAQVPVEKSARELNFETPERALACVRRYFGPGDGREGPIPLDPATTDRNPTAASFGYTPEEDGLGHGWDRVSAFANARRWGPDVSGDRWGFYVNAPYGPKMYGWYAKIRAEASQGVHGLALIPANRFEQGRLHELLRFANACCWVRGRLQFLRPGTRTVAKSPPYPNMILGFNADWARFQDAFGADYGDLDPCEPRVMPVRGLGYCAAWGALDETLRRATAG